MMTETPIEPVTTSSTGESTASITLPGASAAPPPDLAEKHQAWLKDLKVSDKQIDLWVSHEKFSRMAQRQGWTHYTYDSAYMLWRFSSKPKSEFISITAGTSIDSIIEVICKHSAGNDKSNADVRTSSFCTNIGALLGTAASMGGDKNVLHIINNAAYLCGIDMRDLGPHGVSAYPAVDRLISMYETEYVLVSTPGNARISLDTLATVKFPNPLKGLIKLSGYVDEYEIQLDLKDPQKKFATPQKQIAADEIEVTGTAEADRVRKLVRFAAAACAAANPQSGVIKMTEGAFDLQTMTSALRPYLAAIGKTLK